MGARENECHPRYSLMFKLNFYGSFAFLSKGHSIFIQTPPLRMTGFQMGGGGPIFFQGGPQYFDPSDKFFRGADIQRTNPSNFIFQRAATKI